MLRRVALVRTDVSEELGASIIRVTRIGELRRLSVVTANVPSSPILVTLIMEAPNSSATSVLTRVRRHNIPEDAIIHSHRRENLKSKAKIIQMNLPVIFLLPKYSKHLPSLSCLLHNQPIIIFVEAYKLYDPTKILV
jgi:hypothetical protein